VTRIGDNLRRERRKKLLTQEMLAERAGVGYPTVSRIEQGRVDPMFRTIRKLAKALEIDPLVLMREASEESGQPS
jgi:transcriptional regulator with XRE-family HTH domain